jgi:predicted acyltransferase
MYHGEGVAFDPEGWLSTLPAISNVVGGYVVGRWIQKTARPTARASTTGTTWSNGEILMKGLVNFYWPAVACCFVHMPGICCFP